MASEMVGRVLLLVWVGKGKGKNMDMVLWATPSKVQHISSHFLREGHLLHPGREAVH